MGGSIGYTATASLGSQARQEPLVVSELRVNITPFHRSVLLLTSNTPLIVAVGANEVLLGHLHVCATLRYARPPPLPLP